MKKDQHKNFKSGFVALFGAPNTGKSTLLNRLIGEKISITSRKPQTTRNRILGVLHRPSAQLVFIDTPGVHHDKNPLNIRIVEEAISALGDVDIVMVLLDVAKPDPGSENYVIEKIKEQKRPVILALNKIDLVKKKELLAIIDKWSEIYAFHAIIPVSAKHGTQVDELVKEMVAVLPEGPKYYPEESVTDMPERFIAAEMIREKVFRLTEQEIPYGVAVTVESFKERPEKDLIEIQATIHVERESQKPMIIGKGGKMLKRIGEQAREDIEVMVGRKIFLKLWVRVQKKWTQDAAAIRRFGY